MLLESEIPENPMTVDEAFKSNFERQNMLYNHFLDVPTPCSVRTSRPRERVLYKGGQQVGKVLDMPS